MMPATPGDKNNHPQQQKQHKERCHGSNQ
jgi:hypothetical protein